MLKFKHPSTMVVSGPSGSGKTVLVQEIIRQRLYETEFTEIIWCYTESGSIDRQPGITFVEGLPPPEMFDNTPKLVILDDLMSETDKVSKFFTKLSHHRNISVIFITQNLFYRSKHSMDIARNTHYLICFKNPRDKLQIRNLALQIFPENYKYLIESYTDATSKPHGYLLIDLRQETEDKLRVRANITDPQAVTVYVQAKKNVQY